MGLESVLEAIEADKVEKIANKFFEQNYCYFNIVSKILRDDIWIVEVVLTSFGQQSSRSLSIESKTDRIVSCV
jgi:hypothetical protein